MSERRFLVLDSEDADAFAPGDAAFADQHGALAAAVGTARVGEPAYVYELRNTVYAEARVENADDDYTPDLDNAVSEGASAEELDPEPPTPAQRAGFKVGDQARVVRAHRIGSGTPQIRDVVMLVTDDGAEAPLWADRYGVPRRIALADVERLFERGEKARVLSDEPYDTELRAGDTVEFVKGDPGRLVWRGPDGRSWYLPAEYIELLPEQPA